MLAVVITPTNSSGEPWLLHEARNRYGVSVAQGKVLTYLGGKAIKEEAFFPRVLSKRRTLGVNVQGRYLEQSYILIRYPSADCERGQ